MAVAGMANHLLKMDVKVTKWFI